MSPRGLRRLAVACFFLTGATGLIYQAVWIRYLILSFGAAQHSIATVVAAYMLGLGLGSYLLGRIADRTARPARLYAVLELAIAAYALVSPWCLGLVAQGYIAFQRAADPGPATATAFRFVLALVVLALPTVLMGGTLPVLGRALVTAGGDSAGRDFGRLYALNTLGAVAGTLLSGFWLIERLGLWHSLVLGAAINASVGVAILLARPPAPPVPPLQKPPPLKDLVATAASRFALAAALVSGFAALADELVWTRILGLLVGSSTYAFTIILACFLLGIGLGSWAGARRPAADPARRVARAQILSATGATLLLVLFAPATWAIFLSGQNPLAGWGELLFYRGLIAAIAVIPATIGFGATFPALVSLAARDASSTGTHVGLVYAVNTVGSILGAVLAGFVLLHYFSSYAVLRAGVVASLVLAAVALVFSRRDVAAPRFDPALVLGLVVLLAAVFLPSWPARLLDAGAPVYSRRPIPARAEIGLRITGGPDPVVFLREGPVSTVTVRDTGYARYLKVNGKTDASSSADMATQLGSGVLPAAAHPAPRRVLVIGAGSGVTARAVAAAPGIERIDLVEIEPAVIAAGRYFEDVNLGVYRDPRVHILLADGRNHLLTTTATYDLIISEPSNPWMAGVANLFTREFYALVIERLAPGGIFCQWYQRYGLSDDTVRRMIATVADSFAHVQLWRAGAGDNLFLAGREPITFDLARVAVVLDAAERNRPGELATHGAVRDPEDLMALYLLGGSALTALVAGAAPFVDDPPQLEFEALRGLDTSPEWQALTNRAILRLKREHRDDVPATSPALPPGSRLYASAAAHFSFGDHAGAASLLEQAMALTPAAKYARRLGDARALLGNRAGAAEAWSAAASSSPPDLRATLALARDALSRGDVSGAEGYLLAAGPEPGDPVEQGLVAAEVAFARGRGPDALAALESVAARIESVPNPMELLERLVGPYQRLAAAVGSGDAVIASLRRQAALRPRFVELHMLLADTLTRLGRCSEALIELDALERAGLHVVDVFVEQATCRESLGRRSEAISALENARRLEPWRNEVGDLERRLGLTAGR